MPNITAEDQRRVRKKRRDKGLCTFCSRVAIINEMVCEYHKEESRIRSYKRTRKRIAELRCERCGQYLDPDADHMMMNCITCRERPLIPIYQLQLRR